MNAKERTHKKEHIRIKWMHKNEEREKEKTHKNEK